MSHNESNIVSLKLSEYVAKSDAEKVDRKGWINYGDQNDFPQYLRDLSHESPVHGSLVVAIGDMIAGKGIKSDQYQAELDALNIDTLTYACAHDLKLFGGFFIEVIWSNDRSVISKLTAIPFEECRIAINQEDESEIGIYHSYDWSNTRKKKNTPEFIPKYNYLTREQEPRQIYWCFTYTGSDTYPRPDYWSAINYIELDKQISIFHINQISNGLFPSTIINFYNGQATPEQKQQMMLDWENKMSGARNAGKVVMFFNERDQPKTEITPFPVNDADKQYQLMDTTAQQKIITAHRVTTPLLFGIRETSGFGSNKDEMTTGLEIFNKQVIEPYQEKINSSIEELLSPQMPGVTFEIVPNTPLVAEQTSVVTDATATGTTTDVAATALNGAQISSLIDIVMQSAAGAVPVSSAKAIVGAAFPTLPPAVVDAIFADVIAGSLQPTEVIQSSVELKKKVDDSEVASALIALGEDEPSDWLLIDAYNADEEIEHEFAVRTGAARPAAKSEQDAIIDGKYFITRYVYAGSFAHENMRPFCKKMIEAGKLYRKEDIVAMENVAVNPGWGPEGADTYDIWFYKGGGNCKHFWEKRVYVDAKGAKINPNDPDAKRIAVSMAERMGYKVRNNSLVAKLPEDMPYNGFLPTNPVYGNQ
jgi:Phage portal protein